MADYVFEKEFTSSRSPAEVYDKIDDHLIERLGGKVHYSMARRKYVVQGPSRGIKYGPFMKLKIFFDLKTDKKGSYLVKVKMEKKPSTLFWALIPLGIIMTFSGVPLFWLPLLYFFGHPRNDVERVVDSFIEKMTKDATMIPEQRREVYEAIIIEKGEYEKIPEGKVYMPSKLKILMGLSLGITFGGGGIAVIGYRLFQQGGTGAIQFILLGLSLMIMGAIMMLVVMFKMSRTD